MKALVKARAEPGIWMMDVAEPTIGPNDVLIRMRKTAISFRSLGTKPTPALIASLGWEGRNSEPSMRIVPPFGRRAPKISSAVSTKPDPMMPVRPTISPGQIVRSIDSASAAATR